MTFSSSRRAARGPVSVQQSSDGAIWKGATPINTSVKCGAMLNSAFTPAGSGGDSGSSASEDAASSPALMTTPPPRVSSRTTRSASASARAMLSPGLLSPAGSPRDASPRASRSAASLAGAGAPTLSTCQQVKSSRLGTKVHSRKADFSSGAGGEGSIGGSVAAGMGTTDHKAARHLELGSGSSPGGSRASAKGSSNPAAVAELAPASLRGGSARGAFRRGGSSGEVSDLKIGDFGSAVLRKQWCWEEGDGGYAAPELLREHEPTPHADMYSFGAMVYEWTTGVRLPRSGPAREGQVAMPSSRSLALRSLVKRLLSPQPSDRPSAQEVLSRGYPGSLGTGTPTVQPGRGQPMDAIGRESKPGGIKSADPVGLDPEWGQAGPSGAQMGSEPSGTLGWSHLSPRLDRS
eukprot:jgi/Mesen1/2569/ME000162S01694